MSLNEELLQKKLSKFSHSFGSKSNENFQDDAFGGIIHGGKLGWLARGPRFEVYSMKNGQKISNFHFDTNYGFENSIITTIAEIEAPKFNGCLLAIGIQFTDISGGMIVIYSVQGSKILRCIEISDKITHCHYINNEITKRTILQMMQGCIAIGTDVGKIILLDLNLSKCEEALYEVNYNEDDIILTPSHLIRSNLDFTHIRQHYKHSFQENVNFGIELETIENAGIVLSLLSILPTLALVAGLEDGRMIIYDLSELQAFHMAYPPENLYPLVKMSYLEPPDDPKACIYIWAFHESPKSSVAVMHSLMYDKKVVEDDDVIQFEDFQCCSVRLTLPLYDSATLPITCQSITKYPVHGNEEVISLCLLAWKCGEHHSQILIFDLNQWYKEQMPHLGDWRRNLTYLASFPLKHCQPFDCFIDLNTIALFNSMQRSEEHFYPLALSFDCTMLLPKCATVLHWPGLQNRVLEMLNSAGSTALMEPTLFFNEICRAGLMPQLCDYNYNATLSVKVQREIILSVALEYNCFGLLKECARFWADGSHLGRDPTDGLYLSILTDWIWQRASQIKQRCNTLCVSLFDHSGLHIDSHVQKELFFLTRQLKLLADLLDIIIKKSKEYIPTSVLETLKSQQSSIQMASEYHEVLQWLLNIGLLPEASPNSLNNNEDFVSYPFKVLKNFYQQQRMAHFKMNKSTCSNRTKSCRILFIDSFIEHECNPNVLREHWIESGSSNGLYPPPSLQSMLRVLLVPDVPLEKKYILFIYLFLDLNMAVNDNDPKQLKIVQKLIKFPAVFKLNASLIKIVQAFWNLDHGQFDIAVDEIISPFAHYKKLSQWQQELLIEALLIQNQTSLALRVLHTRSSPVNSLLEIKTLMSNGLIAEAFHLARSKDDIELMKTFLGGCLYLGKWNVLRGLALTEEEFSLIELLLKESLSEKAGNLYFINLLEKSKYVEALAYLDEICSRKCGDLETPKLILEAYNRTMTPLNKKLSEIYYTVRHRLNSERGTELKETDGFEVGPLSCQFLKQKTIDSVETIYKTTALSTDLATNHWGPAGLLNFQNAPFVRKPQLEAYLESSKDSISYPEQYRTADKRRSRDESFEEMMGKHLENPTKKRKIIDDSENRSRLPKPINTSLLTKFKGHNSKVGSKKPSTRGMITPPSRSPHQQTLLNTPVIKSCINDADIEFDSSDNDRLPLTHQSILKTKTIFTPVHKDFNEVGQSEADEEKSIRFDLPSLSPSRSVSVEIIKPPAPTGTNISHRNESSPRTCLYDCPQKRRSIHSLNFSFLSNPSADEYYSPISSCDITQKSVSEDNIEEATNDKETSKDSAICISGLSRNVTSALPISDVNFASRSSSRPPISTPFDTNCPEACLQSSTIETSSPIKEILQDERKISIEESNEPPEIIRQKSAERNEENQIFSYGERDKKIVTEFTNTSNIKSRRSIFKTFDVNLSTTRRITNEPSKSREDIATPAKRIKSLSRMVLESNAIKSENQEASSKTVSENNEFGTNILPKQSGEFCKGAFKIDTKHFTPSVLSSKVTQTISQFPVLVNTSTEIEQKRISDSTTIEGEISMEEEDLSKPKRFLPDVSVMSDSFLKRRKNQTLMTTVDMSENFSMPGDYSQILTDSSFDDNVKTKSNVSEKSSAVNKSGELDENVIDNSVFEETIDSQDDHMSNTEISGIRDNSKSSESESVFLVSDQESTDDVNESNKNFCLVVDPDALYDEEANDEYLEKEEEKSIGEEEAVQLDEGHDVQLNEGDDVQLDDGDDVQLDDENDDKLRKEASSSDSSLDSSSDTESSDKSAVINISSSDEECIPSKDDSENTGPFVQPINTNEISSLLYDDICSSDGSKNSSNLNEACVQKTSTEKSSCNFYSTEEIQGSINFFTGNSESSYNEVGESSEKLQKQTEDPSTCFSTIDSTTLIDSSENPLNLQISGGTSLNTTLEMTASDILNQEGAFIDEKLKDIFPQKEETFTEAVTNKELKILDDNKTLENYVNPDKNDFKRTPISSKDKNKIEVEMTPKHNLRRNSRGLSAEPEPRNSLGSPKTRRGLRAASVPKSETPGTPIKKIRNIRASSIEPCLRTPTRSMTRRSSLTLESVEENSNLPDTPSSRTRSRKRLHSQSSEVESPASISEQNISKSNNSAKNTLPCKEVKVEIKSEERKLVSTRRASMENKISQESVHLDSIGNRRLTRTQQKVVEKSLAIKPIEKRLSQEKKKSNQIPDEQSPGKEESENESIISNKSKSSTMTTRSRTSKLIKSMDDISDGESIASSTDSIKTRKRSTRARSKKLDEHLDAIAEELDDGVEDSKSVSKRGRREKIKK